jgi:PEP-CTERM motif
LKHFLYLSSLLAVCGAYAIAAVSPGLPAMTELDPGSGVQTWEYTAILPGDNLLEDTENWEERVSHFPLYGIDGLTLHVRSAGLALVDNSTFEYLGNTGANPFEAGIDAAKPAQSSVPEPAGMALIGISLIGLPFFARRW